MLLSTSLAFAVMQSAQILRPEFQVRACELKGTARSELKFHLFAAEPDVDGGAGDILLHT